MLKGAAGLFNLIHKTGFAHADDFIAPGEHLLQLSDFMGIGDNGILSVGTDMEKVAFDMVRNIMNDELELISIYYGSDVTVDAAELLKEKIEKEYPECDVELQFGGQPIYYYVVSAE